MGYLAPEVLLGPLLSDGGIGIEAMSASSLPPTSGTWANIGAANRAVYVPIYIPGPGIVTKFWVQQGATVTANFDIGLFNSLDGDVGTLRTSTGSTASAGSANEIQEVDVTDHVIDGPMIAYLGLATDSTSFTTFQSFTSAAYWQMVGVRMQSSAFPLPSTPTPARATFSQVPMSFGIAFRSLVA